MKETRKKNVLPGAIAVAFIAAIIIYFIMINVEKNALSAYEKGEVLIAQIDILKGMTLSEDNISQYIKKVPVDKNIIPQSAIIDTDQIIDRMAIIELNKGTILTTPMLEGVQEVVQKMKQPVIAGFKADDLYQVVSGTLRAGDIVHIYTVNTETEQVELVWRNVLIQQVFDVAGTAIQNQDHSTSAQRINIYLEQEFVEPFYKEVSSGSLRVVKALN